MDKKELNQSIKRQFDQVKDRGQVLERALKKRAEIAATRRRTRAVLADLGLAVYQKMDHNKTLGKDAEFAAFKTRVEGLEAELKLRENELRAIVKNGKSKATTTVSATGNGEVE